MYRHGKYALLLACFNFPLILNVNFNTVGLSPENFGPTVSRTTKFAFCKGPKRRDCCQNTYTTDEKFVNMEFKIVVPNDVDYTKIKLALYFNKNATNNTPDVVKWINKPCQHFFFGSFFEARSNAKHNRCIVKKGVYEYRINTTAVFNIVFGGQFFYGTYRARTTLLSKDCNIMCVEDRFVLEKP